MLKIELSGHFSIPIHPLDHLDEYRMDLEKAEVTEYNAMEAIFHATSVEPTENLTRDKVIKLHYYFGHAHAHLSKLRSLIKKTGRYNDSCSVEEHLVYLDNCEVCAVHSRRQPKPSVAIPRASNFNDIVTPNSQTLLHTFFMV